MTVNMGLTNFVPMVAQWQLQSNKDIYDAIDDWRLHKFICVMKDGKQVEVSGIADESECGVCSKYIDFDFNYGSEDIVFWCEIPTAPSLDCVEIYGVEKITETIESTRKQFLKEMLNK